MAIAVAGLAVVAASPAFACYGGGYCGTPSGFAGYGAYGYGYAPAYTNAGLNCYNGFGYGGCGMPHRVRGVSHAAGGPQHGHRQAGAGEQDRVSHHLNLVRAG